MNRTAIALILGLLCATPAAAGDILTPGSRADAKAKTCVRKGAQIECLVGGATPVVMTSNQLTVASTLAANTIELAGNTANTLTASGGVLSIEGAALLTTAGAAAAYQPLDSDLTSWAGVTRASGFDTFSATPSSANLRSLMTDEIGSGVLVFLDTPADDAVPVGDSAAATTWRALPSCSNATTSKLLYNTGTNSFSCGTDQTGSVADADYGDITVSGTGTAWNVDPDAVINGTLPNVTIQGNDPGAVGSILTLDQASASPAANDVVGEISFTGRNASAATKEYAQIQGGVADPTAGSEAGGLYLGVSISGTVANKVLLIGSTLVPAANDGTALGSTGNAWSDLFLASGGVINLNNGDVTLTHSTDTLTVAGGRVTLATSTATVEALNIPAGTLLTTAADGAIEEDADALYATTDAGNRGYVQVVNETLAATTNSLSNVATQQALFNSARDTLTLEVGTYHFEISLSLSGMSATSGNCTIDLKGAGTATVGALWISQAIDGARNTIGTWSTSMNNTAATPTVAATATTSTDFSLVGQGELLVTVAGTIIPSVTLANASAATLAAGSYFRIWRVGGSSFNNVGQWN